MMRLTVSPSPIFEMLEPRLLLAEGGVGVASTQSFANSANGAHPFTISGSSSQVTIDLSSLPAGTQVFRAVFHHDRYGNTGYYQQAPGATSPLEVQAHDQPGVWLDVLAPRYRDFDCTTAVQRAMLLPTRRLVLDMISFPGFTLDAATRLDVWCDLAPVHAVTPVSAITVKHRDGDTMVTFNEAVDYLTNPSATVNEYNVAKAAADAGGITYRIYRSDVPIDATTIRTAELVDEISPLSNWNMGFYNGYGYSGTSPVPRLPVDNEVLSGADEGIYVRRAAAPDADGAYYAVSTVLWGEENLGNWASGSNATAGPIVENTGPGMVLLRAKVLDTDWFYETKPDRYYYDRWECPPTYGLPSTPMDYLVALPNDSVAPRPVDIALHCWGGNIEGGYGWWYEANRGSLFIATNQVPYDWWTGSHENDGTVKPFLPVEGNDGGVVHNFEQERILSFLDNFIATHYSVDLNHVIVSGSSMGGSGAIMWGARASRFAYANGWVGVYKPRQSPGFAGSFEIVYGQDAWNCQYEDTGLSAFDYWDTARFIRSDPGQEIPYLCFANGKNDSGIGWPQAWDTVQALIQTRQPFKFYWSQNGHSTRSQLPGGADRYIGIDIDANKSLPAFTHCSLDQDLGNGSDTSGAAEGYVNRWNLWEPETVLDQALRWEMTVYLQAGAGAPTCSVDITPRRCQQFRPAPRTPVTWRSVNPTTGAVYESGQASLDQDGLLTLTGVTMGTTKRRFIVDAPIPGDADRSGNVDVDDLGILATNYDQSGRDWFTADFSGDGRVAVDDLGILATNYISRESAAGGGTAGLAELASGAPAEDTLAGAPVLAGMPALAAPAAGLFAAGGSLAQSNQPVNWRWTAAKPALGAGARLAPATPPAISLSAGTSTPLLLSRPIAVTGLPTPRPTQASQPLSGQHAARKAMWLTLTGILDGPDLLNALK